MEGEDTYTTGQAARILGMTDRGIRKMIDRGELEEELKNYRLKQNLSTGHAAFEPLREGQHDDLLEPLALAPSV
jgi:hypothetical protein